jgi:PTS system nitrogen regulatory IIA component
MIIERRITFIIGSEGFVAWKINRLKILTNYFRSVIILQNITTGETTNPEHTLKVMSLGCKKNDLCQLWIEGSDAELACMVLTDFIDDQFEIVNTSHRHNEAHSNSIIENHPTFHIPFAINYNFEKIQVCLGVDKYSLISKLSTCLNKSMASVLFTSLLQREKISSTGIGHCIAIPHIMIEGIKEPSIAVFRLDKSINWSSNLGEVNLIIAILIPAPANYDVVKAITQLTRALLDPINCSLLETSLEPEAIKAILFHFMSRDRTY